MVNLRLNTDTLSTEEIKDLRKKHLDQLLNQGPSPNEYHGLDLSVENQSAQDMQNYLITKSNSAEMMHAKILHLSAMQELDKGFVQVIQIHGYIKFDETKLLKVRLRDFMAQNQASFINRLVKYASEFCYTQSEYAPILQWSNMMAMYKEYEWQKAFNNTLLASPDKEVELNAGLIMLLPNPSPKAVSRVFNIIAKQDKLPPCFEFLAKRSFQFVSSSAFHKNDMEPVARMYLSDIFNICYKWKAENRKSSKASENAQSMFTTRTLGIANKAFGIIQESDDNAAQGLLDNPLFPVTNPSSLFIEYFLQYIKLGLSTFDKGDKLIAWNYYYDDRWCGYDRMDLFGEKDTFKLSETFNWCEDFKFAGVIKQHPHHENLILTSKSDDLVQHFAISLSFAGCFKHMINLFNSYKKRMQTLHGYLCLHLCYMYSCAKEGMAEEGLLTWIHIMETAVKNNLLKTLTFPPNCFPLPSFVEMKHVGQFACRLLRNCLWTHAMKNGTESWKKYGLIILHLCDALEDSFLNHNMIRIMFQKISLEDMPLLIRPVLTKCLRHHHSYWDCLNIAKSRGYEIPESILQLNLLPAPKPEYKETPGFLMVYKKLRRLNEIFYEVVTDLPRIVFKDVKEETLKETEHLTTEKKELIKEIVTYQVEKARKEEEKRQKIIRREEKRKRRILEGTYNQPSKKSRKHRRENEEENVHKVYDFGTTDDYSTELNSNDDAANTSMMFEDDYNSFDNTFNSDNSYGESCLAENGVGQNCSMSEEEPSSDILENGDLDAVYNPHVEIKQELIEEETPNDSREDEEMEEDAPVLEPEEQSEETSFSSIPDSTVTDDEEHVLEHQEGEVESLPVEAHFVEAEEAAEATNQEQLAEDSTGNGSSELLAAEDIKMETE
uniref:Ectopic P granules protein 5 homolog n=1 Tax=Caenorhabditis tropicalis TaxID=1561998 RepID=A0A1I7USD3_9PELO